MTCWMNLWTTSRVLKVDQARITRFHPQPTWLWRQWAGTVLTYTWGVVVGMMIIGALLVGASSCQVREHGPAAVARPEIFGNSAAQGLSESWTYLQDDGDIRQFPFFLSHMASGLRPSINIPRRRSAERPWLPSCDGGR